MSGAGGHGGALAGARAGGNVGRLAATVPRPNRASCATRRGDHTGSYHESRAPWEFFA